MHYAYLNPTTRQVTITQERFQYDNYMLAIHPSRVTLAQKIEPLLDEQMLFPASSLKEVYEVLNKHGLIPPPEEVWAAYASLRTLSINAHICDCPECQRRFEEIL